MPRFPNGDATAGSAPIALRPGGSNRTPAPSVTGSAEQGRCEASLTAVPPNGRESFANQSAAFDLPDWTITVERIQAGDPVAMAELYAVFTRGIRYLLLRSLGMDDIDDRVHDCFVIVTEAIRSGELREPARLMGYVRTVVRRHIAASIGDAVLRRRNVVEFEDAVLDVSDWRNNPEQNLLARQRAEIARRVFNGVSRRDREILRRFYLLEQSQERICSEMGLSYNQFRLLKSRAKARFGKLGQSLAQRNEKKAEPKGNRPEPKRKKSGKVQESGH
ncbi:MAG TPA: sigma-70 family RNA polymerase sigma factor [Bryobacteraceae bacterium]|nr:sigma-70 family RNA polymerase sigma factor [Bryobacteraceae bacterium]